VNCKQPGTCEGFELYELLDANVKVRRHHFFGLEFLQQPVKAQAIGQSEVLGAKKWIEDQGMNEMIPPPAYIDAHFPTECEFYNHCMHFTCDNLVVAKLVPILAMIHGRRDDWVFIAERTTCKYEISSLMTDR
jgi:hypothetical protein